MTTILTLLLLAAASAAEPPAPKLPTYHCRATTRAVTLDGRLTEEAWSVASWTDDFVYLSGVGALFLPGQKQEVYGYIEASMFDVKTGLLMFTTRRSISASQNTNQWNKQEKLDKLAALATSKSAPDLGVDVEVDLRRFAQAALAENAAKTGEPIVAIPPMPKGSVATDPQRRE